MTIEQVKFWVDVIFADYNDELNKNEIEEAKRIVNKSLDAVTIKVLEQQPCADVISQKIDEFELNGKTAEIWIVKGKLQIRCLGVIHNIPLLSVTPQPCEDAVSRQAILDIIMPYCQDDDGSVENTGDLRNALDDIESLPPVTPKEKSEYEHDHEVVKAYNDGQAYIPDKIKAEVELLGKDYLGCPQPQVVCDDVIKIIDKHRGDTE